MSVRSYLVSLKKQLESNTIKRPLKFVTGNQSADLDSVISAISYAYFQYKKDESLLIPLINISRNDFRLRKDIVSLLGSYSISDDSLYFIEDFERLTGSVNTPIELTLVDHCNIQGDIFTEYLDQDKLNVVGIIDHHQDESVFLKANPRIIHSNGSCSALIFNYWYDQFDDNHFLIEKNNDIIPLLLGPLLIDTSNMTQKVESGDVLAFKKYQEILVNGNLISGLDEFSCNDFTDIETSLSNFYRQIKRSKKDLSGFSFYDILKKDYKQFKFISKHNAKTSVGFSSIGKSFYWLLSHYSMDEISSTFDSITQDFNLDLLIVTSSYSKKETDEYTREFGYYFNAKNTREEILTQLPSLAKSELKLNTEVYKLDNLANFIGGLKKDQVFGVYNQQNTAASRKQIVPLVKNILEKN